MAFDFHPTGDRIRLPPTFADRLAAVYDRRPETVWEWWMLEGERSETAEQLVDDAYTDERTRHEVHVEGQDGGGYTPCVLDAIAAAAMEDGTATVRSTDPVTGTVVTVEFDDAVRVEPRGAVNSIGQKPQPDVDVESWESIIDLSRAVDLDVFVENFCKYGNAFESEETYARWSAEADADSFAASAEQIATLLYRLHRASRAALVAGILRTFVADGVRAVIR